VTLRLGLSTPVVVQVPGVASLWEALAGPDELTQVAQTADELGYDHLTCSEHVAVPVEIAEERGSTYWDPLATLSFLAAHTRRIRLATSVVVLGYHHPLALAKRYGTLDRLSRGRLVLGVGVGSLEQEFALLGASWSDRGARADDAMQALRAALGVRVPSYDGPGHSFGEMVVEPHAVQRRVPLWVGGRTARSLRRAVEHGDGWVPFGLRPADLAEMLAADELPDGFEVVLSPGRPLDPLGDPDGAARRLLALHDAGATVVSCAVRAESVGHHCDQLAALCRVADRIDAGSRR
jgi:probable F420-dependent oxidoreductase